MSSDPKIEACILTGKSNVDLISPKLSPIQVVIDPNDSKGYNILNFPADRYVYFLGYHRSVDTTREGLVVPDRFYLLHGSIPMTEQSQPRPELSKTDVGLEMGFSGMMQTLKISGLNYDVRRTHDIMFYYDRGFDHGGHKGSLTLQGTLLQNKAPYVTTIQAAKSHAPLPPRLLRVLERYI